MNVRNFKAPDIFASIPNNVYVRLIAISTITITLYMIIRFLSFKAFNESIFLGIQYGFILAITFSAPLSFLHYMCTRKTGIPTGKVHPKQQCDVVISCEFDEAFHLCKESLLSIGATISREDINSGTLTALTRRSLKSMGEKIDIKASRESSERLRIEIFSNPRNILTIIDYGKGLQNTTRLKEYILNNKHALHLEE